MQIANVFVALDQGNLVPKYGVTAAEIAVLQAIHGAGSVVDIEPAGTVDRANTEELGRLRGLYGGARNEDNRPVVDSVFPIASSVAQNLDDLELDQSLFKATKRAGPNDKPTADAKRQAKEGPDSQTETQPVSPGSPTPPVPSNAPKSDEKKADEKKASDKKTDAFD